MNTKVLLVVQPSLSHYREAFVKELVSKGNGENEITYLLAGRYTPRAQKTKDHNSVHSASNDIVNGAMKLERKPLFGNFFWDKGLFWVALKERADLTILEGNFYNLTTISTGLALSLFDKKVAFWGHGWKRPESGPKLILRRLFYAVPKAHFVYGDRAAEFAKRIGLNRENWFVIYNSIYSMNEINKTVPQTRKAEDTLSLVFSGRLTKRHGVSLLIDAIEQLVHDEGFKIQLTVVGNGSEMENLRNQARKVEDAVDFLGAQHDLNKLREAYSRADFAVSPGASGLNVIQALGFGRPVIAADGDPQSGPEIEAIEDEVTGLFFEHEDVEDLKKALRKAANLSNTEYQDMSVNGLNVVRNRYNAESQARLMDEGIRSILSH